MVTALGNLSYQNEAAMQMISTLDIHRPDQSKIKVEP
jgi:hypothetical protein